MKFIIESYQSIKLMMNFWMPTLYLFIYSFIHLFLFRLIANVFFSQTKLIYNAWRLYIPFWPCIVCIDGKSGNGTPIATHNHLPHFEHNANFPLKSKTVTHCHFLMSVIRYNFRFREKVNVNFRHRSSPFTPFLWLNTNFP